MSQQITRRKLAAVLGTASAMSLRAQETSANPPEDPIAAAKDQLRKDAEAMAKVELALSAEPAFLFKA